MLAVLMLLMTLKALHCSYSSLVSYSSTIFRLLLTQIQALFLFTILRWKVVGLVAPFVAECALRFPTSAI